MALNDPTKVRGGPHVYFKEGAYGAKYAVASTRLARFLGMDQVIAHNAFATISEKNVVSGEVPGVPVRKLEHNARRNGGTRTRKGQMPSPRRGISSSGCSMRAAGWSSATGSSSSTRRPCSTPWTSRIPRIQKGLSDLQIFDAISGQLDRHGRTTSTSSPPHR